jgi:hypothetical protein
MWAVTCILAVASLIATIVSMMNPRLPLNVPVLLLAITLALTCLPLR